MNDMTGRVNAAAHARETVFCIKQSRNRFSTAQDSDSTPPFSQTDSRLVKARAKPKSSAGKNPRTGKVGHAQQGHPRPRNSSARPAVGLSPASTEFDSTNEETNNRHAADCQREPGSRPADPRFSSGPCRKHPGWDPRTFNLKMLGRSHRASAPKARLQQAIERSARLLDLPPDWKLGIVPGSDTGAFEMAMWSMLGSRAVDVLVWESFSTDWAKDLQALPLPILNTYQANYGKLPCLSDITSTHDLVFVYNGTTSGVRVPDLNWISQVRDGLVLCDATSAAFAMPLDFSRLDVITWSWQKVLGGEAAHGMLALGPKAIARLETTTSQIPLPKIFTLTKNGKLADGIFNGSTINTPSMLAVEDLHSALDWAESIGGSAALFELTRKNFDTLNQWVNQSHWIDWLAEDPATRSETSMCLKIVSPEFTALSDDAQRQLVKKICAELESREVAYDINSYRSAPPGFRIWGGPTVSSDDISLLTQWLDWAWTEFNPLRTGA